MFLRNARPFLVFLFCAPLLATGDALAQQPVEIVAWGDSLTRGEGGKGDSWPAWFTRLSDGIAVVNKGVGGQTSTQIKDRMLADKDSHGKFTVIWAGRNNAFDQKGTVQADIAAMVAALEAPNYLVVGIPNGAKEPKDGPDRWKRTLIDKLNASLKETYGDRFVDIRPLLISAYDPSQSQDVQDHADDVVPASLRSDALHLNSAGYKIVAQAILGAYQKLNPKK
jgi:lysophospholipase L1-like esterase